MEEMVDLATAHLDKSQYISRTSILLPVCCSSGLRRALLSWTFVYILDSDHWLSNVAKGVFVRMIGLMS